jgi:hypothetical protein
MFNGSFHSLGSFTDPNVASQYPGNTAFQVEEVNNQIYVTFGGFTPPFGGVVDVFDTDGHLLTPRHFAANAPGHGPLVNPWGIVPAPADFGPFSHDILIGNVEDGRINAFDPHTGTFLGSLLRPDETPIEITGLWDLAFGAGSRNNGRTDELFFTAGATAADFTGNGLFGMITATGERGDDPLVENSGDSSAVSADALTLMGIGQNNAAAACEVVPGWPQVRTAAPPRSGAPAEGGVLAAPLVSQSLPIRRASVPDLLATKAAPAWMLDQLFADLDGSTSGALRYGEAPAWVL